MASGTRGSRRPSPRWRGRSSSDPGRDRPCAGATVIAPRCQISVSARRRAESPRHSRRSARPDRYRRQRAPDRRPSFRPPGSLGNWPRPKDFSIGTMESMRVPAETYSPTRGLAIGDDTVDRHPHRGICERELGRRKSRFGGMNPGFGHGSIGVDHHKLLVSGKPSWPLLDRPPNGPSPGPVERRRVKPRSRTCLWPELLRAFFACASAERRAASATATLDFPSSRPGTSAAQSRVLRKFG